MVTCTACVVEGPFHVAESSAVNLWNDRKAQESAPSSEVSDEMVEAYLTAQRAHMQEQDDKFLGVGMKDSRAACRAGLAAALARRATAGTTAQVFRSEDGREITKMDGKYFSEGAGSGLFRRVAGTTAAPTCSGCDPAAGNAAQVFRSEDDAFIADAVRATAGNAATAAPGDLPPAVSYEHMYNHALGLAKAAGFNSVNDAIRAAKK
jgi:hypothetical protein